MFISNAYAQGAGSGGSMLASFLPMIAIFAIFYFLIIRPQLKRTKDHRAMVDAIKKGDEVVTNGGIAGKVVKVTEEWVHLDVAQIGGKEGASVEMKLQKAAVQTLLPNGTIKAL